MNKNDFKEWKFSLFYNVDKGLNNCEPLQEISLHRLISVYKSSYLQEKSKELSTASDEQKEKIKNQLPYITPTGTYSYRKNENIKTFNCSLLPLDIDNLNTKEEAIQVQKRLSNQKGCVLSIVSPRGKGVKALFYLGCEIDMLNYYTILKENRHTIAKQLYIEDFEQHIDINQFKLSQPFFIGYNENNFFNLTASPTDWVLLEIEKKIIEYKAPLTTNRTPGSSGELMRIEAYIINECKRIENYYSTLAKGERHANIWKVRGIAGIMHYCPSLTSSINSRLENAIIGMYKDENEAKHQRAIKTFADCWSNAPQVNNDIIEEIIKDEINKMSINLKSIEQ